MTDKNIIVKQEFAQVHDIITLRRTRALQAVNNENLLSAWEIGAFVSARLKNADWGSKTVMQLSEYLRSQDPTLRGYSKRTIYKMVLFYETYSSTEFQQYAEKLKLNELVQAQLESVEIVQAAPTQLERAEIVQSETGPIVPSVTAQFPFFLHLTTLTHHFEILNACKTMEEVLQRSLEEFMGFLNKEK